MTSHAPTWQSAHRAWQPALLAWPTYALLVLLAAIWGASFTLIKVAVDTIPAVTLTASRLILAAAVLAVVALIAGQRFKPTRRLVLGIAAAGFFGNALPFTLISWGEEVIDSGLAAILMAVMPLTTVFLAHLFTGDEKLNTRKLAGVILGLAGLVVLIGPAKLTSLGTETIRQLAVAGAALCYGINAIITKRLLSIPPMALAAAIIAVSAVMMIPASLILDQPWTLSPSSPSLWATIGLGVLQTALATLIMFQLIARQGATFFAQINFLVPLAGVAYGVIFLAERPAANAYLALAIILTGIAIARSGMGKRLTEKS